MLGLRVIANQLYLKNILNFASYLLKGQKTTAVIDSLADNNPRINVYRYNMTEAGSGGQFKLTEVEGDLFSAPKSYSLAHCVGADFTMGAGIAVKFKEIYGQVEALLSQKITTGGVAVLQDNGRFLYYLVTKLQSYGSPTYGSLRSSLEAMREHMRTHNVNKLAIPRIGCGIDGLEWNKVNLELQNVFRSENLEITVYNFVPKG